MGLELISFTWKGQAKRTKLYITKLYQIDLEHK
jgi:hypothetical protein